MSVKLLFAVALLGSALACGTPPSSGDKEAATGEAAGPQPVQLGGTPSNTGIRR